MCLFSIIFEAYPDWASWAGIVGIVEVEIADDENDPPGGNESYLAKKKQGGVLKSRMTPHALIKT